MFKNKIIQFLITICLIVITFILVIIYSFLKASSELLEEILDKINRWAVEKGYMVDKK